MDASRWIKEGGHSILLPTRRPIGAKRRSVTYLHICPVMSRLLVFVICTEFASELGSCTQTRKAGFDVISYRVIGDLPLNSTSPGPGHPRTDEEYEYVQVDQ